LELLSKNGVGLPQSWMAGDDEMGRPYCFRRRLAALGERYLLAVPSNTALRDLETAPPAESGRGRPGQRPWHRVEPWSQSLREASWQRIDVRDGRKGPLGVEAVKRRVVSRPHRRQQGEEETLVVIRSRDRDQQEVVTGDSSLSKAVPETPLGEFARVAKAAHRMEACLQSSKSEAGLADYEVRHWRGWQHHQTLSLLATWFLGRETARGKKMDPGDHLTADSPRHRHDLARGISMWHEAAHARGVSEAIATQ
jgi:SRSO17 transposase